MPDLRILLCYSDSLKKVVTVPENVQPGTLKELAASSFGIDSASIGLQNFDADFQEWVLIASDFVPADKERLQVVQIQQKEVRGPILCYIRLS